MFKFVNSFKHVIFKSIWVRLNSGYMIFAYIKTLDNVHKARALCTLRVSNQNTNWYSIKQLSQHTELVTTSTSYKWTLTQGFCVEKILPLKTSLCGFTAFRKGIAQTYTMS